VREYKVHQPGTKGASSSPSESRMVKHKQSFSGLPSSVMNQSHAAKFTQGIGTSANLGPNPTSLYTSIRKAILNEISGAKAAAQNSHSFTASKDISHEIYSSRKSPHLKDVIEARQKESNLGSIYDNPRSLKDQDNSKLGISVAGTSSAGVLGMKTPDTILRNVDGTGTLSNIQKKIKIMLSGQSNTISKERPASNQTGLASRTQNSSGLDHQQDLSTLMRDRVSEENKSLKGVVKKVETHHRPSEPASILSGISMKLLSRGRDSDQKFGAKPHSTKIIDTSNKEYPKKFFGEHQTSLNPKMMDAKSYIEKALGKSSIQESLSKKGIASSFITNGPNQYKLQTDASLVGESQHQNSTLKTNHLYQRFSQKLAAKAGYDSVKEPVTAKDHRAKADQVESTYQNTSLFTGGTKGSPGTGMSSMPKTKPKESISGLMTNWPDVAESSSQKEGSQGLQGLSSGHKRAESENLKKLFSSTPGELSKAGLPDKSRSKVGSAVISKGSPSIPDDREELAAKPKTHTPSKSINLSTTLASLKAAAGVGSKKNAGGETNTSIPKGVGVRGGGNLSNFKAAKATSSLETIKRMEPALPQFESAKVIVKEFGRVKAFAVNTHQGLVRSYNEDRVSILLNAQQR
jgi:hypothetical protein